MISRRQILLGGLATAGATGGILAAGGAAAAQAYKDGFAAAELKAQTRVANSKSNFNGKHQAGIEQRAQAHANFIGFDLKPGIPAMICCAGWFCSPTTSLDFAAASRCLPTQNPM